MLKNEFVLIDYVAFERSTIRKLESSTDVEKKQDVPKIWSFVLGLHYKICDIVNSTTFCGQFCSRETVCLNRFEGENQKQGSREQTLLNKWM